MMGLETGRKKRRKIGRELGVGRANAFGRGVRDLMEVKYASMVDTLSEAVSGPY